MQASEKTFRRNVATQLARVVNRYPDHMPYLIDYCRRHVNDHAEQLIQLAQEAEGALGQALTLLWSEHSFDNINTRILPLLPERTVQLRDFTVEVLKQVVAANQKHISGINQTELRTVLVGRLREAGRFTEALSEALKIVDDRTILEERPELQALAWGNLAVIYADTGDWDASYKAHLQATRFYQAIDSEGALSNVQWLGRQCVNLATVCIKRESWSLAENWISQGLRLAEKVRDEGLLLSANLVRVVLLAENGRLQEALALGAPTLDKVRDLEEIDQQSYAALLLNVYLTLGSILLDLHRVAEAHSYFTTAQQIANDINQRVGSIGSATESVRAMLALSQTQILQRDSQALQQARTALAEARRLFEDAQNDYQREIVLRAIEAVIGAEVELDCQPQLDLIEELLGPSDRPSVVQLSQEEIDTVSRRLHLAGMTFAKLDIKDRALTYARKAAVLFDAASENRTAQQAAQRAVLYDGLSLRLEEAEQLAEATEKAEAACRILLPIFAASPEIYEEWMWKLTVHFRELAIKTNQFDHFMSFFKENLEPLVTPPSENSSQLK